MSLIQPINLSLASSKRHTMSALVFKFEKVDKTYVEKLVMHSFPKHKIAKCQKGQVPAWQSANLLSIT